MGSQVIKPPAQALQEAVSDAQNFAKSTGDFQCIQRRMARWLGVFNTIVAAQIEIKAKDPVKTAVDLTDKALEEFYQRFGPLGDTAPLPPSSMYRPQPHPDFVN